MRGKTNNPMLIATMCLATSVVFAPPPPEVFAQEAEVQRGAFNIQFTESNPLSEPKAQHFRYGVLIDDNQRYTLAEESYEAYVPDKYQPGEQCGLMVWVNAGDTGKPPEDWIEVLKKRKLIWIGANHAGNPRKIAVRFGLALDAVHNMRKLYNIDPQRVYVSGISGGGKCASMLGLAYPEVFTGSVPIVGVSYFRNIRVPDDPKKFWQAGMKRPAGKFLDQARLKSRFVLITGSEDFNRDSTKGMYEDGFVKDRFKYVQYVEVPDMGHQLPPAEVMDSAIEFLDAPVEVDQR